MFVHLAYALFCVVCRKCFLAQTSISNRCYCLKNKLTKHKYQMRYTLLYLKSYERTVVPAHSWSKLNKATRSFYFVALLVGVIV